MGISVAGFCSYLVIESLAGLGILGVEFDLVEFQFHGWSPFQKWRLFVNTIVSKSRPS